MRVAITGASGFIGGQIALNMREAGHEVLGIDRRPLPTSLRSVPHLFYQNDYANDKTFSKLDDFKPDAIVHCAGTSLVGPSMINPSEYYQNNVVKTLQLLDYIVRALPATRIIFSSSASVYGRSVKHACKEDTPQLPVSPYGESKLMVEKMLASFHKAYGLDYISFRFFNACGADSRARHGQEPGATHIIAKVLESVKLNKQFVCNGNDYDTRDGTCIRDYVHVEDISRAHILALDTKVKAGVYNLGTEQGFTNLEVIEQARSVTGAAITVEFGSRRPGDPDSLTANSQLFQEVAGWRPQFNLKDMVQHAWNWYRV